MDKKKIIILLLLVAAAAYYFYTKGNEKQEGTTNTPKSFSDIVNNSADPNAKKDVPYDKPKGQILAENSNKDIAKYYSSKVAENPFLNPIILPGFLLKRLKRK